VPDLAITFTDEYLEECDREENKRVSLNQFLRLTEDSTVLRSIGAEKFRETVIMYLGKGGQR